MNKIFMDRSVMPSETVALQKKYIDDILGLKYDLDIYVTPDKQFYVSKIKIKDMQNNLFNITRGKGTSLDECLASNYGELIERLSWSIFLIDIKNNRKIELKNIITDEYNFLETEDIFSFFGDGEALASGNNIEEAKYHALCDIIENGHFITHFPYNQLETTLAKTENMFPEVAKKYHDNYHMFVQRDLRLPSIYTVTVLRKPYNRDILKRDFLNITDKNVKFDKFRRFDYERPGITPSPWPAMGGKRVGLNLKKLFLPAIAESVQLFHALRKDEDFELIEGDYKKYPDNWKIKDAMEYSNNEKNTIEEDNRLIINEMKISGFNLWEIDVTLPNCPMKAIKIINDYTLSGENPFAKRFLSRIFK